VLIFFLISLLFTTNLSICARDATLPAPGTRYWVDGNQYQIHLACVGNKTLPSGDKAVTIFLEAGEDPVEGRLQGWVDDAYQFGAVKRYCYWDRPGIAWSETAPSPLSAGMAVDALSEALRKADETGPWVLAAHGVGGIYARVFASRHVTETKGMLLIDTLPESLLHRVGDPKRGFLLWLRGVIYPLGIDRAVSAIILGHGREDRVYGRDAYMSGGVITAKLQENLVAETFTKNEIEAARAILPRDMPVIVVSSGTEVKRDTAWFDGQRELSHLGGGAEAWDVVDGVGHEVWRSERGREVLEKRLLQLQNAD
jgi:pimeloyl-ACP methyl ester carboxylesterase